MKDRIFISVVAVLGVLAPACSPSKLIASVHAAAPEPSPAPAQTESVKVEGERITFDHDAPQLANLSLEPAASRSQTVLHFNGRLVWDDEVTLGVFTPVAGRVTKVIANLGQAVEKGAPLAEVESPDYGQAQADVVHAESDYALASRTLNRARELFAHGAAPRKDVEAAEADAQRTLAEKERSEKRLALYGGRSGVVDQNFVLRAPIRGVVVERSLSTGQEIRPDQILANAPQYLAPHFVISDPKQLWVLLDITEKDIALVRTGQHISVSTKAYPDKTFPGEIQVVGSALDPATRTVKVRGWVDNKESLLKAEMYVTVDVTTTNEKLSGVTVSPQAVYTKGDKNYLFVAESPGVFVRREIARRAEENGRIPIVDDIKPGARVVTQGCLLLQSLIESKGSSE